MRRYDPDTQSLPAAPSVSAPGLLLPLAPPAAEQPAADLACSPCGVDVLVFRPTKTETRWPEAVIARGGGSFAFLREGEREGEREGGEPAVAPPAPTYTDTRELFSWLDRGNRSRARRSVFVELVLKLV